MHDNAVFTRDDLNKTDNTNVVAIISILHVDGVAISMIRIPDLC